MNTKKTPEAYFNALSNWQDEMRALRAILLATQLQETLKWGAPCYTLGGKNLVGLGAMKSYFALWFHQGALLADKQGVLVNAQKGKTQALRQWRIASGEDINPALITDYISESIALMKAGKTITPRRNLPLVIPKLLQNALAANPDTKAAFAAMRPGLQREYADYISEAKREATQHKRLDKILPMIANGIGLNDKYR
jgi:uncharacterized protein YdeI (YjbR/CyaY-like superfamily)